MLIRQIKAVLMTYLARRAYHLLILTMLAGLAVTWLGRRHYSWRWPIATVLFEGLLTFLVPGSVIVALTLFFLQARNQLMGLGARLFPQSRTAHLIVIGLIFFGLTVAISSVSWHRPGTYPPEPSGRAYWYEGISPIGSSIFVLLLMTLAAYAAWNPWCLPILGFALFYWATERSGWVALLTTWYPPSGGTGIWAGWHQMRIEYQAAFRAAVFLANLIALEQLVKLARPRPLRPSLIANAWRRMTVSTAPSALKPSAAPHTPMTGILTRGRHRRFAVHSHSAPWVLAIAIGVVLAAMFLISSYTHDSDRVMAALVMLTLVPGVVVAAGWRERWSSLGYESLLPSRRDQFVGEIAIALAADLIQFWLAALVTLLPVLAAFSPRSLATGAFAVSIVASAMMQLLWLGAIFLTSRFRQIAPYFVVLIGSGLVMLLPISHAWYEPRGPLIPFLFTIATIEMATGLLFLVTALGLWRRADLA